MRSQRRLASDILNVGESRVWIDPDRVFEVEAVITREEIKRLIHEGVIRALPKKGVSGGRARVLHKKKRRGLRKGVGRRKGSAHARLSKKQTWMNRVRALRRKLRKWKDQRRITQSMYRQLYRLASSGVFKSIADMERHLDTKNLWRRR